MRKRFVVWLAVTACAGKELDTDDSDPSDTDSVIDHDQDGVSTAAGDCNDSDATIFPGAPELTADTIDQNCDGSLFVSTLVSEVGSRWDGAESGMAFGEELSLVPASDLPGALMVSGTAAGVGEYGGDGAVHVFSAAELLAGTPAGLALHHTDEGTTFGRGVGTARLANGDRVWLAGFSDVSHYAGFCAWGSDAAGTVAVSQALACPPAFVSPDDQAFAGFADGVDVQQDGNFDLTISGTAAVDGERTGAIWVVDGPLSAAALGLTPHTAMAGFTSIPAVFAVGDLTGDGVADVLIADSGASGDVAASGLVYLVPGGAAWPTTVADLVTLAGARQDGNTGRSVVALHVNNDAVLDVCLSAPLDETAGDHAGRVGCFFGPIDANKSMDDADITYLAERPNVMFGESLAALDVDHDGVDELVVGAPGDGYLGQVYPGKVYVFSALAQDPMAMFVGEVGDRFGSRVAAGDIDGDGLPELAVGAPGADNATGAVYVVFGDAGAW